MGRGEASEGIGWERGVEGLRGPTQGDLHPLWEGV